MPDEKNGVVLARDGDVYSTLDIQGNAKCSKMREVDKCSRAAGGEV